MASDGTKSSRRKPLCSETKNLLINLYEYFKSATDDDKGISVTSPAQLVTKSTGISMSSVRKVLAESKCLGAGRQFKPKKPRKRIINLDHFDKQAIINTIHNFHYTDEEFPTMKTG